MKKTRILAVIVFLILILNLIIPSFSFAIEQENNETDLDSNTVNEVNGQDLVGDQNIVDENDLNGDLVGNSNLDVNELDNNIIYGNNMIGNNRNVNILNDNVLSENNDEELQIRNLPAEVVDNEEISFCIMDGDNRINHYEKNGKYYLFVPKSVKLSEMVISYTGNIESVSNAELDENTNQITGNFKNEGQFIIT